MFNGFTKETFMFLKELSRNNNKTWFDAHRVEYENLYMEPARQFVDALGPKLLQVEQRMQYEAKVNKSIFRINRDIRFSKDKTPYKNHIDMWFWLGERKGWDEGGFFIRITPSKLVLGAGIHNFEKNHLEAFRKSVLDNERGRELSELVKKLKKHAFEIGEVTRKTVPKGYDANHERAEFLLYEGLVVMKEEKLPVEISTVKFVDYCLQIFKKMNPLNSWLQKMINE